MFNLSFYVICWLCFFLLCLPIIFSGLFAAALDTEKVEVVVNHLKDISEEINKNVNDKDKLRAVFNDFMSSFKTYPKDGEDYELWVDVISRFAANMNLMEVDEGVNLKDTLENANPDSKVNIREAIGKALQKREGK